MLKGKRVEVVIGEGLEHYTMRRSGEADVEVKYN